MTLEATLVGLYSWLDTHAVVIAAGLVFATILGVTGAWVGRAGKSDRDGRWVANATLGLGFSAFVIEVIGLVIANWGFQKGLLDANLWLLMAPVVGLGLSLSGIRLIYPLAELGSATTARDIGLFVLALFFLFWIFSEFRGWGIVFFGGLVQMLLIGLLLAGLVRYLYRRIGT